MFPRAAYPLTVEQLRAAVAARSESTVMLQNGLIIAFANFYLCQPGEVCAIGNVIVAAPARGQGAGRALIEAMARIAFTKYAVQRVEVSCFNQNTAGLLFYPKLGFTPLSIEERLDSHAEKVALIHLALTRPHWLENQSAESR